MVDQVSKYVPFTGERNFYAAADAFVLGQHLDRLGSEHAACLTRARIAADCRDVTFALPPIAVQRAFANTLSSERGSTGQFNIPEGFLAGWIRGQSARNVVRNYATVTPVGRGGDWALPTANDATNEGEMLAENQAGTTSDVTFGRHLFRLKKFASHPTKVPVELEQDGENFPEQLGQVLAEQVGRIQNRKYTVGTGVGEPQGIVTAAATVSSVSASAISVDDFIALLAGVGDAFCDPATSYFMVHRDIWTTLLKLKDGSGRYLVSDSGKLFGQYRIILNGHMDSTVTTGNRVALFGRMDRYHIAEGAVRMQTARETFAEADQVLYRALQRADGRIASAGDVPFAALQIS